MTDTWALDAYREQEEARNPLRGYFKNYESSILQTVTDNARFFNQFSIYEPSTDSDREMYRDIADKERVFWADQYDMCRSRFKYLVCDILELHAPVDKKCLGCDFEGVESEHPEWPCRTTRLVCKGSPDYSPEFPSPPLRKKETPPKSPPYITYAVRSTRNLEFGEPSA